MNYWNSLSNIIKITIKLIFNLYKNLIKNIFCKPTPKYQCRINDRSATRCLATSWWHLNCGLFTAGEFFSGQCFNKFPDLPVSSKVCASTVWIVLSYFFETRKLKNVFVNVFDESYCSSLFQPINKKISKKTKRWFRISSMHFRISESSEPPVFSTCQKKMCIKYVIKFF